MFSKILLATDFSEASRAALFAGISVASRCLARIESVHVITYLEDLYQMSRFLVPDADWKKEIQRQMDEFLPDKLYPNCGKHILLGRSIPEEILKYAQTEKCDLIVIGSHGRNALANLIVGSVTQQLTRTSSIPVMVIRDLKKGERYQGFHRILVPVDFSGAGMTAVKTGIAFANFLSADLHLVHVVDQPGIEEYTRTYPGSYATISPASELNVDPLLKQMVDGKVNGNEKVCTLKGDPATEIVRYVKENNVDFVIMGTHGRKGLERILLGSVTTAVLARSTAPVITVSERV